MSQMSRNHKPIGINKYSYELIENGSSLVLTSASDRLLGLQLAAQYIQETNTPYGAVTYVIKPFADTETVSAAVFKVSGVHLQQLIEDEQAYGEQEDDLDD